MATQKYSGFLEKDHFEELAWGRSKLVCGIDEAGRGCLAGPVVVAAAVIPAGTTYPLLKDSKTLTQPQREEAFDWIQKKGYFSWVTIDHYIVDNINIYQATIRGMKRALMQLVAGSYPRISHVLVDAMPLTIANTQMSSIEVAYFFKGESKSSTIAAASIVAKVKRDALMKRYHTLFRHYQFDKHKGYGTQQHQHALVQHGPSIVHRRSFLKNYYLISKKNEEKVV